MKDKLLQIRVNEDFLSKLEYLQRINGFKTTAETVRKIVEKEFRKEKDDEGINISDVIETVYKALITSPPTDSHADTMSLAKSMVNDLLSIQQTGKWIMVDSVYDAVECKCSLCGQTMTTHKNNRMNYCPNCGAKMEMKY